MAAKKTVPAKKQKVDSIWANNLAVVKKKTVKRLSKTAKRTAAFQKQKLKNTARRLAAGKSVDKNLRLPKQEKINPESLLPRKINNESVVDM